MPKSKKAPALLEVYRRGDVKQPPVQAPRQSAHSDAPLARSDRQAATVEDGPTRPEPWMRAHGDRLRFSLNMLSLAVVIAAAIAVVGAGFIVGRSVGYDAGRQATAERANMISNDQFREIRQQAPEPEVLEDLDLVTETVRVQEALQKRETRSTSGGFIDNLNYVWIERFNQRPAAVTARSYLDQHGISSVLVEQNNNKWLLISKDGFDYAIPEEKLACRDLTARIKELGRQYFDAGGRYRFDCFVKKKLPGDTW